LENRWVRYALGFFCYRVAQRRRWLPPESRRSFEDPLFGPSVANRFGYSRPKVSRVPSFEGVCPVYVRPQILNLFPRSCVIRNAPLVRNAKSRQPCPAKAYGHRAPSVSVGGAGGSASRAILVLLRITAFHNEISDRPQFSSNGPTPFARDQLCPASREHNSKCQRCKGPYAPDFLRHGRPLKESKSRFGPSLCLAPGGVCQENRAKCLICRLYS